MFFLEMSRNTQVTTMTIGQERKEFVANRAFPTFARIRKLSTSFHNDADGTQTWDTLTLFSTVSVVHVCIPLFPKLRSGINPSRDNDIKLAHRTSGTLLRLANTQLFRRKLLFTGTITRIRCNIREILNLVSNAFCQGRGVVGTGSSLRRRHTNAGSLQGRSTRTRSNPGATRSSKGSRDDRAATGCQPNTHHLHARRQGSATRE